MSDEFDNLPIDGSAIREMILVPAQSLQISILKVPEVTSENQVTTQYLLRFDKIRSVRSRFEVAPWVEIKSHRQLLSSQYLKDYKESESSSADFWQPDASFSHFHLVLDRGELDVIAEQFSSTVEAEIPHLGRFIYPSAPE